ncbi:MAG: hypothetical protein ACOXZ9_03700 [Bacteroidales bacterium]|jgi:hypothetical protein
MSTLTTAIIVAVITGLLSNLPWIIRASSRLYKDNKNTIVKRKRIIFAIMRYTLIIAITLGIYFGFTFSKMWVIFIMLVVLLCSYFIATDVLYFTMCGAANVSTKENLLNEKELWLEQLATCDSADKERQAMCKQELKKIEDKLASKSYKSY